MPSRVDRGIERGAIDIGCIVMTQAVTQKTFFGLRRIDHNFRRVEGAKRSGTTRIKHIISERLKRLLVGKLTRTEFEKWHHIHAGLPLVAHSEEGCFAGFGVARH